MEVLNAYRVCNRVPQGRSASGAALQRRGRPALPGGPAAPTLVARCLLTSKLPLAAAPSIALESPRVIRHNRTSTSGAPRPCSSERDDLFRAALLPALGGALGISAEHQGARAGCGGGGWAPQDAESGSATCPGQSVGVWDGEVAQAACFSFLFPPPQLRYTWERTRSLCPLHVRPWTQWGRRRGQRSTWSPRLAAVPSS